MVCTDSYETEHLFSGTRDELCTNASGPVPKNYDVRLEGHHIACPVCNNTERFLRTRGPHIGEFCANDHRFGEWLGSEHFMEGGDRRGQLPPEDFDKKRRRRAKRHQLVEHIRIALQLETTCFLCRTQKFDGPRQAYTVKAWLQQWRPSLYARLMQRFRRNDGTNMVAIPKDWPKHIDQKFRDEISQELDFSNIQGDHLIPVRLLELIEPGDGVSAAMLEFAGRRLGVPVCERCNRGRNLAGMERVEVIMNRWTQYAFDGNVVAAKADERWSTIEAVAERAYRIEKALQRIGSSGNV